MKSYNEIKNYKDIYNYYLFQIERKTKLNRNMIYLIISITFISFIFGYFDMFVSYLVTLYYPIKWSIEDFRYKNENYYKLWISYWIIFGLFFILDIFHNWVLIYFPLYFFIRTYFLLWVYLPCFKGGILIYDIILNDWINSLQHYISETENKCFIIDEINKQLEKKKKKL